MADQPGRNHNHYAIVVGINEYEHVGPTLQGAVLDAADFRDWLTAEDGGNLPDDADHILECNVPQDGTRPQLGEIVDLFAKLFRPEDDRLIGERLYIFLAGHGVGETMNDASLLAADHKGATYAKQVAATQFAERFAQVGLFHEIVVFMDCCRNEGKDYPEPWNPFGGDSDPLAASRCRRLYGFATGHGLKAREKDFSGDSAAPNVRGIFTTALLEALRQAGPWDSQSLSRYVANRVGELKDAHSPQEAKFPICEDIVIVSPREVTVRIHLLNPTDDFDICFGGDHRTPINVERSETSQGVWEVKLAPQRLYLLRSVRGPKKELPFNPETTSVVHF